MKTKQIKLQATFALILFAATGFTSLSEPNRLNPEKEALDSNEPEKKTVKGKLSGFDCAVVGFLCPTTHRGADYTVGVVSDDGPFYHLVNIPQSFFRQYFLQTVEVTGLIYPPYEKSVEPEKIHIIEDGDRRLVYDEGYFIDKNGRRATFNDGRFTDGRWVVE